MLLRVWRFSSAVIILLFLVVRPVDAAVVDPELARALAHYERGNFSEAVPLLTSALADGNLERADRRRALEALGVSYYVLGKLLEARKQFTVLLDFEAEYEPDALYVPPEIVAFVADVRNSHASMQETPEAELKVADSKPTDVRATLVAPEFRAMDLLPFGIAQFRKGHVDRGLTLAITQGLLLTTNIGLYYYRRCEMKSGCDSTYYPEDKLEQARRLQSYQLIAGYLFLGSAALGIVDGVSLPVGRTPLSIAPVGAGVGLKWRID